MRFFRSKSKSSSSRLSIFQRKDSSEQQPPDASAIKPTTGANPHKLSTSTFSSSISSYGQASPTERSTPVVGDGYAADTAESESERGDDDHDELATPSSSYVDQSSMKLHNTNSRRSSSTSSTASARNSLASFRQLRCSMTYKNRHNASSYRDRDTNTGSFRGEREAAGSVSSSSRGSSTSNSFVSETPLTATMLAPTVSRSSGEVRMAEANVAAMQTRRAFQQMALAMEDDDSDNEYDSESDVVRSSSDSGVMHIGVDEYRKFQFRLRQLEELCQEQARKQANMEATIEAEVQARTKKVEEAMEKKIAMYKQAKELECEREIQKRVLEHENSRTSGGSYGSRDSGTPKTKPLDKLFHPRRAKKRSELLREQEEQQRREMEQFREFIRSTEMRSTSVSTACGDLRASQALKALNDPTINDTLLEAPPAELVEIICVLRRHVSVQEKQLDQAKSIITAAIEAREEAEATAREAVELTLELDHRLERASQEMGVIRDELRRSVSLSSTDLTARISQCSSFLSHSTGSQSMMVTGGASSAPSPPVLHASSSSSSCSSLSVS